MNNMNEGLKIGIVVAAGFIFLGLFFGNSIFPFIPVLNNYQGFVSDLYEEGSASNLNSGLTNDTETSELDLSDATILLEGKAVLQEQVPGTGKEVTPTSTVTLTYRGATVNPRNFEEISTFDAATSDSPFVVDLSQGGLIAGFTAALIGGREGSSRTVYITPEAGYGSQAIPNIPANSTLKFEIEILSVE